MLHAELHHARADDAVERQEAEHQDEDPVPGLHAVELAHALDRDLAGTDGTAGPLRAHAHDGLAVEGDDAGQEGHQRTTDPVAVMSTGGDALATAGGALGGREGTGGSAGFG